MTYSHNQAIWAPKRTKKKRRRELYPCTRFVACWPVGHCVRSIPFRVHHYGFHNVFSPCIASPHTGVQQTKLAPNAKGATTFSVLQIRYENRLRMRGMKWSNQELNVYLHALVRIEHILKPVPGCAAARFGGNCIHRRPQYEKQEKKKRLLNYTKASMCPSLTRLLSILN